MKQVLNLDDDLETKLRSEILEKFMMPLLESDKPVIISSLFSALSKFPLDEVAKFLPPPDQFVSNVYKDKYPSSSKTLLKCFIKNEITQLGFRGLNYGSKKILSDDYKRHKDRLLLDELHSELRNTTNVGISYCFLYSPCLNPDSTLAYEKSIARIVNDIQFSLLSSEFLLELFEGWKMFNLKFFEDFLQNHTIDKVVFHIDRIFSIYTAVIDNSTIPSEISSSILVCASILIARSILDISGTFSSIFVESLLHISSSYSGSAIEVKNSARFALSKLYVIPAFRHPKILNNLWLQGENSDFIFGYGSAVILESNLEEGLKFSKQMVLDFIEFYLIGRDWKSLGAAIGFAYILASEIIKLESFLDEKVLKDIISLAHRNLTDPQYSGPIKSSAWILCKGFSKILSVEDAIFALNIARSHHDEKYFQLFNEFILRLRFQTEDFDVLITEAISGQKKSVQTDSINNVKVLLELCFETKKLFLNRERKYVFQILFILCDLLKSECTPTSSRKIGYSAGLCFLFLENSQYHSKYSQLDPVDYKKLFAEVSYINSTFELFKNDDSKHNEILEIFGGLDIILPPVNWSFLIERNVPIIELVTFCGSQCSPRGSKFLHQYFLESISKISSSTIDFICSDSGFGKLLHFSFIEPVFPTNSVLDLIGKVLCYDVSSSNLNNLFNILSNYVNLKAVADLLMDKLFRLPANISYEEYTELKSILTCLSTSSSFENDLYLKLEDISGTRDMACLMYLSILYPIYISRVFEEFHKFTDNDSSRDGLVFIFNDYICDMKILLKEEKDVHRWILKVLDLAIIYKFESPQWYQFYIDYIVHLTTLSLHTNFKLSTLESPNWKVISMLGRIVLSSIKQEDIANRIVE